MLGREGIGLVLRELLNVMLLVEQFLSLSIQNGASVAITVALWTCEWRWCICVGVLIWQSLVDEVLELADSRVVLILGGCGRWAALLVEALHFWSITESGVQVVVGCFVNGGWRCVKSSLFNLPADTVPRLY